MSFAVQHVHLKTRDPKADRAVLHRKFRRNAEGRRSPGRGFRVDLHGVQLNITGLIAVQNHEQHYGIEHMAVETDDYAGTLARATEKRCAPSWKNCHRTGGRHVCFVECPDGAQMEIIERRSLSDRRMRWSMCIGFRSM